METIDTTSHDIVTTHDEEPDQDDAAEALARIEPELDTVDPEAYVRMNVDVPRAIRIGLGTVGRLRALRPQIAELPGIAIAKIDKLEDYALAAWYANGLAMPPTSPDSPIQPLLEEAVPLRQKLLAGADALATFGFFPPAKVAETRAGKGFLDTANDCGSLAGLYREHWAAIEHKTPVTREEVDRAAVVGTKLLKALGADGTAVVPAKAAERRVRAFSLFVSAHDEARRAVTFVRWYEGDAETIVPPLFPKARRRPSTSDGDTANPTEPALAVGTSPEPS